MKITLKTKLNQDPIIEVDGKNIVGMGFIERLNKLNVIMNNIPDLPNWFQSLLTLMCYEWGKSSEDSSYELEL